MPSGFQFLAVSLSDRFLSTTASVIFLSDLPNFLFEDVFLVLLHFPAISILNGRLMAILISCSYFPYYMHLHIKMVLL